METQKLNSHDKITMINWKTGGQPCVVLFRRMLENWENQEKHRLD